MQQVKHSVTGNNTKKIVEENLKWCSGFRQFIKNYVKRFLKVVVISVLTYQNYIYDAVAMKETGFLLVEEVSNLKCWN